MIELTDKPIDSARVLACVNDPECGAQVLFIGTTRQWTHRLPEHEAQNAVDGITRLETECLIYDSYREMAVSQMQRLVDIARGRWPVKHVALVHRLGRVEPTEASVAVAVSCPHRSEAFEAARWLIDELKHQVPIWKQEHYVQTGPEWIHPTAGNCNCHSDHGGREHEGREHGGHANVDITKDIRTTDISTNDSSVITQVQQSQQ